MTSNGHRGLLATVDPPDLENLGGKPLFGESVALLADVRSILGRDYTEFILSGDFSCTPKAPISSKDAECANSKVLATNDPRGKCKGKK